MISAGCGRQFLIGVVIFCNAFGISSCAHYDGRPLVPGVSSPVEVEALMGPPVMRWRAEDGSEQWAYPKGPLGVHTFMLHFDAQGRLQRRENVLTSEHFARLRPGLDDQQAVLRLFGPPNPVWTVYYQARDELVWEWLICDDWSHLARFSVLFDGSSGLVRSSMQRPELVGRDSVAPWCSR